jgi:hypothetical protein
MRQTPYNEALSLSPSLSPALYLQHLQQAALDLVPDYVDQCLANRAQNDGELKLDRIDVEHLPPSQISGRGNFYFSTVSSLTHFSQQLQYLVENSLLPIEFLELSFVYEKRIVPFIIDYFEPGCVVDAGDGCGAGVRYNFYMLPPWMIELTQGTWNRLLYHPAPPPPARNIASPFALNPDLPFDAIESAYHAGSVLAIDNFLTPAALHQLRHLSLTSTTFFDAKSGGYLGAYVGERKGRGAVNEVAQPPHPSYLDDGLTSPWITALARELQERLPTVIGGLSLMQAWMYK